MQCKDIVSRYYQIKIVNFVGQDNTIMVLFKKRYMLKYLCIRSCNAWDEMSKMHIV